MLEQEELHPLLRQVHQGEAVVGRDIKIVTFPRHQEPVVDDEVDLPRHHHVEEGGEAGVGDPLQEVLDRQFSDIGTSGCLGSARSKSHEGDDVVRRAESEALLDVLEINSVLLPTNVSPYQVGVTAQEGNILTLAWPRQETHCRKELISSLEI